jgi:NAD(P)-dependent dehydrogenase (short-subunit alcohol dehydrogenase family)
MTESAAELRMLGRQPRPGPDRADADADHDEVFMSSSISFEGKSVIVTGAGAGLGRAYALELGRRGASVVVNDAGVAVDGSGSSQQLAEEIAEEIRALGGRAATSYSFVGTQEAADEIVGTALDAFGRLDAVISNAGNLINAPFAEVTLEDYERLMTTHLDGSFWLAQRAYRAMSQGDGGRIVLISSGSGIFGRIVQSAYGAAKAGILGLTRVIALEGEEHGILANAILPTALTRMAGTGKSTPELEAALGGIGSRLIPENVVPLAVYLASDACTTTGDLYSAVAGRYARVVIGLTEGWFGGDEPATVEELAEHWDEVRASRNITQPAHLHDELVGVAERFRLLQAPSA